MEIIHLKLLAPKRNVAVNKETKGDWYSSRNGRESPFYHHYTNDTGKLLIFYNWHDILT